MSTHKLDRIIHYPRPYAPGYVAWCSCGVGSPSKATKREATRSLARHIADPQELPR